MTLPEIKASLERAIIANGKELLLRPNGYTAFIELDPRLVMRAFEQIEKAVVAVSSGLDHPSSYAAETLLLQIFEGHAKNT